MFDSSKFQPIFQVYHTEFDTVNIIDEGSIQRGGENLIAVAEAILNSPNLGSSNSSVDTKWVFYDVAGLFTISYRAVVGKFFGLKTWRTEKSELEFGVTREQFEFVGLFVVDQTLLLTYRSINLTDWVIFVSCRIVF